jgi:hypothetical protein
MEIDYVEHGSLMWLICVHYDHKRLVGNVGFKMP